MLKCVPVSWAQYVASTKARDEVPIRERFHRLAGSCLMISGDENPILTFRSKRAERYPDVWQVGAAGYIERADVEGGNPMSAMLREIHEEMNLQFLQ